MKYVEDIDNEWKLPLVELTRRNLEVLLAKLDDPVSKCTIIDGDCRVAVRAVENDEHYRNENRLPGLMFMPSTGELL